MSTATPILGIAQPGSMPLFHYRHHRWYNIVTDCSNKTWLYSVIDGYTGDERCPDPECGIVPRPTSDP